MKALAVFIVHTWLAYGQSTSVAHHGHRHLNSDTLLCRCEASFEDLYSKLHSQRKTGEMSHSRYPYDYTTVEVDENGYYIIQGVRVYPNDSEQCSPQSIKKAMETGVLGGPRRKLTAATDIIETGKRSFNSQKSRVLKSGGGKKGGGGGWYYGYHSGGGKSGGSRHGKGRYYASDGHYFTTERSSRSNRQHHYYYRNNGKGSSRRHHGKSGHGSRKSGKKSSCSKKGSDSYRSMSKGKGKGYYHPNSKSSSSKGKGKGKGKGRTEVCYYVPGDGSENERNPDCVALPIIFSCYEITMSPTEQPTSMQTPEPTPSPSLAIVEFSDSPSSSPTNIPSSIPLVPPAMPTGVPSMLSDVPSSTPTFGSSVAPTLVSDAPSTVPTELATSVPTAGLSDSPSSVPTRVGGSLTPSSLGSNVPSITPSQSGAPSVSGQTLVPSGRTSEFPSIAPSQSSAPSLSGQTPAPSGQASDFPSSTPSQSPAPTQTASDFPSFTPSISPAPTSQGQAVSDFPSSTPSVSPAPTFQGQGASDFPSATPSVSPAPTAQGQGASDFPSLTPSTSVAPTANGQSVSDSPSSSPTFIPLGAGTLAPGGSPSPSNIPSRIPTPIGSNPPGGSDQPSDVPSAGPSTATGFRSSSRSMCKSEDAAYQFCLANDLTAQQADSCAACTSAALESASYDSCTDLSATFCPSFSSCSNCGSCASAAEAYAQCFVGGECNIDCSPANLFTASGTADASVMSNRVCDDDSGRTGAGYQICLDLETDPSDHDLFERVTDRWTSVIVGDLPAVSSANFDAKYACQGGYPQIIDDMYMCIRYQNIDGLGGVLGLSIPVYTRASGLPATGLFVLDASDVAELRSQGMLESVVTHQYGHALGFGSMWEQSGLIGSEPDGCKYLGVNANFEWQVMSGCWSSTVPVERDQNKTKCTHWAEDCLNQELMTGASGAHTLSRITIASMEDLGYTVDYSHADPFTTSDLGTNCPCFRRSLRKSVFERVFGDGHSSADAPRKTDTLSEEGRSLAVSYGSAHLEGMHESNKEVGQDLQFVGDRFVVVLYLESGVIHHVHVSS